MAVFGQAFVHLANPMRWMHPAYQVAVSGAIEHHAFCAHRLLQPVSVRRTTAFAEATQRCWTVRLQETAESRRPAYFGAGTARPPDVPMPPAPLVLLPMLGKDCEFEAVRFQSPTTCRRPCGCCPEPTCNIGKFGRFHSSAAAEFPEHRARVLPAGLRRVRARGDQASMDPTLACRP